MRSRFLGTTTLLLTVTTVSLQVSKCMELEEQCREEEKQHWARVAALIQVPLSLLRMSLILVSPEEQGSRYHLQKPR